jgi:RNA polymerase sigma-70 factor (ECF subfamily)
MSGIVQPITLEGARLTAGEAAGTAEEQFAALVYRQSRFAFGVAYAVLRNVHDAEDAAQEAFLKLYRTGAWKGINDERAFLARTVWRVAVDRSSLRRKHHEQQPNVQQLSPEEQILLNNRNAIVRRLVDGLPDDLRLPLALSYVEDLRSHEIANVMGIPDATVRTRIARARRILKEKLKIILEGRHG